MPLTDAELVRRALDNQMSAFQELIERYKKKIYYTAIGIVSNHHDAEDVLQDTMLQALRSLEKLRQPEGFGPWIIRIAFNRAIDVHRRRKREFVPGQTEDKTNLFMLLESESPESMPDKKFESKEISSAVDAILRAMPQSQKHAFVLKHIANLSIREIAVATNSTESTVKTNIYRAVQKLRRELMPMVRNGNLFSGAISTETAG